MTNPYLSVVVVSRNDDHGGNMLQRMQLFVSGWMEQARRFSLNTELVIVEWNPPSDRPQLSKVINWPVQSGPCAVRIIQVPPEIHQRFRNSDKLPLFQMIGKNVGIRRAQGSFILATNMDILFSDELVQYFSSCKLEKDRMYRLDRSDVSSNIPFDASITEQLIYCREHIVQILGKSVPTAKLSFFQKMKAASSFWKKGDSPADVAIYYINQIQELFLKNGHLHTNACGDFTLMAREHWLSLNGYSEFEGHPFYLDALLCYSAHFSGAKETILDHPLAIYHLDHAAGPGSTPRVNGQLLGAKDIKSDLPRISDNKYHGWCLQMRRKRRPMIFNDDNWGLAQESLREDRCVNPL